MSDKNIPEPSGDDAFSDIENLLSEEKLLSQLKQYREPTPQIRFTEDPIEDAPSAMSPVETHEPDILGTTSTAPAEEKELEAEDIPVRKSIFDDPEFRQKWEAKNRKSRTISSRMRTIGFVLCGTAAAVAAFFILF